MGMSARGEVAARYAAFAFASFSDILRLVQKGPLVTDTEVPVPVARGEAARQIVEGLRPGMRVALTTHVNADGDGAGSEVGLWHLLTGQGIRAVITNPTRFPDRYGFLLSGIVEFDKSSAAVRHIQQAELIIVLDISDISRLGHLGRQVVERGVPVVCIDHHLSDGSLPQGPRMVDSTACATGELVYDLLRSAGWPLTPMAARALYVAIMTDTGGFRFSNTTSRALRVAADLLAHDVDPEEIYRMVYASNPEGRVRLVAEVIDTLIVEPDRGLAWVTIPPGALERHGVDADQLEGIVEYPRSIEGIRLALLFRTLANGRVKVSFRSVGNLNVAELAEQFGGGGHQRAAGALLEGDLPTVQERVLSAARAALEE
jgi:bifunctional oligoribonuclease and PAP phosphatase NrnA